MLCTIWSNQTFRPRCKYQDIPQVFTDFREASFPYMHPEYGLSVRGSTKCRGRV